MTQFKKGDRVRFECDAEIVTNWHNGEYDIMPDGPLRGYRPIFIPTSLVPHLTLLPPAIKAGDYVENAYGTAFVVLYVDDRSMVVENKTRCRYMWSRQSINVMRLPGRPADWTPEAGE